MDIVQAILKTDISDVNRDDKVGKSPLFLACVHGHSAVARALLKVKLDGVDLLDAKHLQPQVENAIEEESALFFETIVPLMDHSKMCFLPDDGADHELLFEVMNFGGKCEVADEMLKNEINW